MTTLPSADPLIGIQVCRGGIRKDETLSIEGAGGTSCAVVVDAKVKLTNNASCRRLVTRIAIPQI
jgi:hypothetical protein